MMNKGLRISLIAMGLFFILLGIFLNFQLYISLAGDQFFYKYSYGAIGIGLDISKVICLILGAYLIRQTVSSLMIAGLISLVFWLILSLISWAAGWGFTLFVTQKYESEAFQKNMQVQAVRAGIEDAQLKVEQLSQYANSTGTMEAKSKSDELQNQLNELWAAPAKIV
ncbi:membrane protein [Beggiatoa sp. PS]|nr:membrane protein [Beggiatoa sp. PS]